MKAPHKYALVFAVSLTILVAGISTAPMTFDEPAHVGAARNFLAEKPSINTEHPPLAKYFIALSIKTFGDNPLGWRFPSALAGAFLALSLFGLTLRLSEGWHTAYIAWLLTIANGFWFVMSRVALLSIFELAFEAAAVWAFVIAAHAKSARRFVLSGVVGLVVCVAYAALWSRTQLKRLALMCGVASVVYAISWIPLLIREHRAAQYLIAANKFIYQFHRHAKGDPQLGEAWWSWLFRLQPQPSLLYLVGDPVIEILGLVAVVILLWRRKPLLPALYIAHVLQWAIAIKPLTFYYYYFEAFTWLTVALAVAMQRVTIKRVRLDVVVTACAMLMFVHWYANVSIVG
jgi:dolichyl-phosphate-mannose-protein mannosyltransferase